MVAASGHHLPVVVSATYAPLISGHLGQHLKPISIVALWCRGHRSKEHCGINGPVILAGPHGLPCGWPKGPGRRRGVSVGALPTPQRSCSVPVSITASGVSGLPCYPASRARLGGPSLIASQKRRGIRLRLPTISCQQLGHRAAYLATRARSTAAHRGLAAKQPAFAPGQPVGSPRQWAATVEGGKHFRLLFRAGRQTPGAMPLGVAYCIRSPSRFALPLPMLNIISLIARRASVI